MKLPSILNLMTDDLAIDLGTSRTRVFARGRGIVVNEPSLLAYDQPSQEVVAVGLEALELEGRASGDIQIISPLKDGVVSDPTFAGKLLEHYLRKARDGRSSFSRRVLVSIPAEIYSISHITLKVRVLPCVVIAILAVVISFLATLYPARAAAKVQPVEALRYE